MKEEDALIVIKRRERRNTRLSKEGFLYNLLFRILCLIKNKQGQKIIDLVNEIMPLQKKLHESKLTGGEKERLEQQIQNIDYELNQEIYKLYEITKEEQKIIEESLK